MGMELTLLNGRYSPPKIPEGQKLIDFVRSGINQSEKETGVVAKKLGLTRELYVLARKLTILIDRQVLTVPEEEEAHRALFILERTGSVSMAQFKAKAIIDKYWIKKSRTGQAIDPKVSRPFRDQLKRFENTLFAIREACSNNDELEVPLTLTRQERDDRAKMLVVVIEDLWDLHDDVLQIPRRRRT